MPELPEVETVKRVLSTQIIGLTITDIKINYSKMILNDTNYFKDSLIGNTINSINRKGKALIFEIGNIYMVSHLRMEGKYYYKDIISPIEKHEHIIFYLSNGMTLRYHDTRKFGIMVIKNDKDLYTTKPLSEIGSEPWDINENELYNKIHNKKLPIKTVLLDQSNIAGLGNIYVNEVLFLSKINPHTSSNLITLEDCRNIINHSINVLNKSIECKGCTIRSYTSSLGVEGSYQKHLLVHTKEVCPICSTLLIKDKTNGRGTYYCPKCQTLKVEKK